MYPRTILILSLIKVLGLDEAKNGRLNAVAAHALHAENSQYNIQPSINLIVQRYTIYP